MGMIDKFLKMHNTTVLHITHNQDDVWYLANKVAFIKQGELLQFGQTNEVLSKPRYEYVTRFSRREIIGLESMIKT